MPQYIVEMDADMMATMKNSGMFKLVETINANLKKIVETGEPDSYATRREAQEFIDRQENPEDWDIDVFPMGNKMRYAAVNKARFGHSKNRS